MNVPQEVQILIDLGLTSLQARIYFALCQTEMSEAATISKVTKVARSDVYRTLYKLHDLGLVEKEITNPITFRPIPMETGILFLLESKTNRDNKLKSEINFFLPKIKNKTIYKKSFQRESRFVMIPSRGVLIKKLKKAIHNTQISIDVSTSFKRFKSACCMLAEPLNKAWSRGVNGRLVMEDTEADLKDFKACWNEPSAKIRKVSNIPKTVMAIYDNKEVFIYTEPIADMQDSPALWTNNPSILAMAEDCFETLWKTAKKKEVQT